MRVVFSPEELEHQGGIEVDRGRVAPTPETPQRAKVILEHLQVEGHSLVAGKSFPMERLAAVHDVEYLSFLGGIYEDWKSWRGDTPAAPPAWPRLSAPHPRSQSVAARLARYSYDVSTSIMDRTWAASKASAFSALTAAELISSGVQCAFALCRPPGHHAGSDYYGGYCFLNNAAVAAQYLRDAGAARVAVVDIDFHHGNGTQDIFYRRSDVLYASLHATPSEYFPYFWGWSDERGRDDGEGYNINVPLQAGTSAQAYLDTLTDVLTSVARFRSECLVVSLGVDTFEGDPLGGFHLRGSDFYAIGRALGRQARPTVFVMEGGYALDALGSNVGSVLSGFENA
jgi:acetoin utilization deacetylase AcuC-like enzyme